MSESERQIRDLMLRYAELQDAADWDAIAELFADADFEATSGVSWRGQEIADRRRVNVVTYDDGTPRTKHLTTNLEIEVDEEHGTATAHSYYTILQATDDLPLQPIGAGRYVDRFQRVDGEWRFAHRRSHLDLRGHFTEFRLTESSS